uniref:PPUP8392 n=1 Tax=Poeciliopsis prolifica TaxID=188132 RepID=A0A0S7EVX2_9TELE
MQAAPLPTEQEAVLALCLKHHFSSHSADFKGASLSSHSLLPNPPNVSDLVSWPRAELPRDGPLTTGRVVGREKEKGETNKAVWKKGGKQTETETEMREVLRDAGLLTTQGRRKVAEGGRRRREMDIRGVGID